MIRCIIFDMAGTTIHEDNLVYKTMHQTLVNEGINVSLEEVLSFAAGKEKKQALYDVMDYLGLPCTVDDIIRLYNDFNTRLIENYYNFQPSYCDGATALFQYLRERNIKVAFNTGYGRHIVDILINKVPIEIDTEVDLILCADDVSKQRPNPDMIYLICDQLGIAPTETIKVGDSAVDIQEGHNAGVHLSIGITTGAHDRSKLQDAKADFVIDHLSEMIHILEHEDSLDQSK